MARVISVAFLAFAAIAMTACGAPPPDSAYMNRGGPESLLDVSSEVVSLPTQTAADRQKLADWIAKDQPTRAEMNCTGDTNYCAEMHKIFELNGVPFTETVQGAENTAMLVYERILARDCSARYVDNPDNFHNTYHPAFGCATAANIVQHVTNKQEFINPPRMDDASAVRGVDDIHRAYVPREVVKPYQIDQSLAGSARTN